MNRRAWTIVAVLLAISIGVAAYSASLLFSESVYSNRGSFAYWLTVSSVIKEVPEISPEGDPRFYSSVGDGPKLSESAVSYQSMARPDTIMREIDGYLITRGYQKRADGAYEHGTSIVFLEISPKGSGTQLSVKENY